MIELLRYARIKPKGLVSAQKTSDLTVTVYFKRFDVEDGKEVEPETSILSIKELETRLTEIETEKIVILELLKLQ